MNLDLVLAQTSTNIMLFLILFALNRIARALEFKRGE